MTFDVRASTHRRARAALVGAFLLILAGGLVTSRDAGLAVPDWPLAFGQLNPPGWWQIENIRTEHGHRILAFCVALWTAFLLVTVLRNERLVLLRRLTIAAAGIVILQALLGGLRVLHLSVDLAMIHGVVGQLFFATLASVVAVSSPTWNAAKASPSSRSEQIRSALLFITVFAQLLLGLFIRHLGAQARPMSGSLLFYLHVLGAGLVLSAVLDSQFSGRRSSPTDRALLPLVCTQILLGIATFVTTEDMVFDRQVTPLEAWLPTLHVGTGAALLAVGCVRNLHAWGNTLDPTSTDSNGIRGASQ